MNDINKPLPPFSQVLNEHQRACIDLLDEALEEAKAGRIFGCGLVLCLDGGWATNIAGSRPGDLNLGCDDLKYKIHAAVTGADQTARVKAKASPIIKIHGGR